MILFTITILALMGYASSKPGKELLGFGDLTSGTLYGETALAEDQKICAVYADHDALVRVSKMWVPHCDKNLDIWWHPGTIEQYVEDTKREDWDRRKTLRLSVLDRKAVKGTPQWDPIVVRIPSKLQNEGEGAMGLSEECKDRWEDFSARKVDFGTKPWLKNAAGRKEIAIQSCKD